MAKKNISAIAIFSFLILIAFTTLYPIGFMVVSSFKQNSDYLSNIFGMPARLYFNNYFSIADNFNVLRLISNTLVVTILSNIICLLISSLAAFSFAKITFVGKKTFFTSVMASMMVPSQVLMIPVFILMAKLHLINNYFSLILFYVAISIPYSVYMLTANCSSIPNELIESSKVDGAHVIKIFYKIILPMLKPAVITLFVLNFLWYWNELLYSMIMLQDEKVRTLTVAIATIMGRYTTNMPLLMAGLSINCIPTILIFVIFQKYIVKGITVGAIK